MVDSADAEDQLVAGLAAELWFIRWVRVSMVVPGFGDRCRAGQHRIR